MIVLEPLVVANRALRKSYKKNESFPLTAQRIIMRSINTPIFFVILSASQRVALFGSTFNGSTSGLKSEPTRYAFSASKKGVDCFMFLSPMQRGRNTVPIGKYDAAGINSSAIQGDCHINQWFFHA